MQTDLTETCISALVVSASQKASPSVVQGLLRCNGLNLALSSAAQVLSEPALGSSDIIVLDTANDGIEWQSLVLQLRLRSGLPIVQLRASPQCPALSGVSAVWTTAGAAWPDVARGLQSLVAQAAPARPRAAALRERPQTRPVIGLPLIVIGCSTGGPPALERVLTGLNSRFAGAILVAQHMPAVYSARLAERLDRQLDLSVQEVSDEAKLAPGSVYIGQGGSDLIVERSREGLIARCVDPDPSLKWHPSVERLVRSAHETTSARQTFGVMLTGMGDDGANAMAALHRGGGRTVAQAKDCAVVWGMPGALVARRGATTQGSAEEIAGILNGWIRVQS